MIREDRRQLNERFVKVFNMLQDRGEIVLNDRHGKGMGDFAEKILGNRAYGHIIRAFLNPDDKRVLDYRHARALCREYNVNESYMIDGVGTPFGLEIPRNIAVAADSGNKGNILFTSAQAFAGSEVGFHEKEELEYFALPGLYGDNLVAFPIEGKSMEPVINDGDVIICRQIDGAHEIKDNHVYTIKSEGMLWVKYVQRMLDKKGRVRKLKLISANYLEFDPFEKEVNEYTRLFKVIRRLEDFN